MASSKASEIPPAAPVPSSSIPGGSGVRSAACCCAMTHTGRRKRKDRKGGTTKAPPFRVCVCARRWRRRGTAIANCDRWRPTGGMCSIESLGRSTKDTFSGGWWMRRPMSNSSRVECPRTWVIGHEEWLCVCGRGGRAIFWCRFSSPGDYCNGRTFCCSEDFCNLTTKSGSGVATLPHEHFTLEKFSLEVPQLDNK